jgi:capsular exopolysaccharide synthesis family protein
MSTATEPEVSKPGAFSYHTVLAALRCWWRIVVPISIVAAGVSATTVVLLHKSKYTASGWLMIKQHRPPLLGPETRGESQKFIQTQIELIRSPDLLKPLISRQEIVTAPELVREMDPTLALARLLSVKPRGQSDIYVVSFTSQAPEKAEIIVKSVIDAYLAYNRQSDNSLGNEMVALLNDQAKARRREMEQLREDLRKKSISATTITPLRSPNEAQTAEESPENPFANLQTEIVRLQVEQDVLAARIKAEEQHLAEQAAEPAEREIERQIGLQPRFLDQQALIADLEQRVVDFQKTGKNLNTNPLFKQLQANLAKQQAVLEKLKSDLAVDIRAALVKQMAAESEFKVRKFKEEHEATAVRLSILESKFAEGMNAAKRTTSDALDLEFMRAKLHQVTAIHDAIHQRILHISTEKGAPSQVSVANKVTRPTQPDEVYPWKKMGMAGGLAFLLPLAACVAWECFFRRISSRSQVENIHQLTVVGEVTSLPSRSRNSTIGVRSAQRDVLLFEESVDSLRTYLSLSQAARDLRVIAVSSAVSGEGKTSLAAQLAVCIARATREPTLLIDGDLRSPDVHNIFKLEVGPGLAEVLQNDCPLEEAIETSFSERMHILTAGRLRTNPHRLLGSGDFDAILDKLRVNYRHIIIDTPPVLPASEALIFARAADTAILCMRRDFSRMDQSQAAFSRMTAAGVHVSGAVLNGIPTRQYAYKYGTYEATLTNA